MMWERCRELVEKDGGRVVLEHPGQPHRARRRPGDRGRHYEARRDAEALPADHVISSMPLPHLLKAMDPPVPDDVRRAADDDSASATHLTVALVVPPRTPFPDNWIYVHDPEVEVGRIQNFGSWSPYMVKDGRTCLGLEYFVFEGDETCGPRPTTT